LAWRTVAARVSGGAVMIGPHPQPCICTQCEDCRAIAAVERLYESLTEDERVESAGVVISRRIFEMREASCGR
jgi:hypothetical protein